MIETIKVKPWGAGQGEFVIINADDFDPAVHKHFDESPPPQMAAEPAPELPPASAEKPVPKQRAKSRRRKGAD